jgi:hypothetical protein
LELLDPTNDVAAVLWINKLPFRIGRDAICEGCVASSHVSRIHAVIELVDGGEACYQIRDNHSTNGTKVNGERIQCEILHDGNLIGLGPIMYRFVQPVYKSEPLPEPPRPMCMVSSTSAEQTDDERRAELLALRHWQEIVLQGAMMQDFVPVQSVEDDSVRGYRWLGPVDAVDPTIAGTEFAFARCPLRTRKRFLNIARRTSVEEVVRRSFENFMLLPLTDEQLVDYSMLDEMISLGGAFPSPDQLIVEVTSETQRGTDTFPSLRDALRAHGIRVCFSNVSLDFAEQLENAAVLPDLVLLDDEVLNNVTNDLTNLARLTRVLKNCVDQGCVFIAPAFHDPQHHAIWQEVGGQLFCGDRESVTGRVSSLAAAF